MSLQEDLKAYVDGELPAERHAEIEAAVASDPGLRQEVEFMRALGFEIKRMAAEPAIAGREAALKAVRGNALPWWNPYSRVGRLAYSGALAGLLIVVLFPVFAQPEQDVMMPASDSSMKSVMAGADAATASPQEESAGSNYARGRTPADMPNSPTPSRDMSLNERFAYRTPEKRSPAFEAPATIPGPEGAGKAKADPYGLSGAAGGFGGGGGAGVAGEGNAEKLGRDSGSTAKGEAAVTADKAPGAPPQANRGGGLAASKAAPTGGAYSAPLRMVIQSADVNVRVKSVEKAVLDATSLAKSLGGFIENSTNAGDEKNPEATLVIRVPSYQFDIALKRLTDYGERIGPPAISSQDVTRQYADLSGRLKVLHAEEESYVTMLRGAKKIGEILEIKDRLSTVRQEIQSLEEQRIAVRDQSELSTVTVHFSEKPKIEAAAVPEDWSGDAWVGAVNGLKSVGRFLGMIGIFFFVYIPIWAPPVALFWVLSKKGRQGHPTPAT
ncbi:MAG: DUF4349 domain-containing protein [Armatimonadetes bacterium]|nr:DUF4349 domain-containing protein [Armatimonadota bacterium]